MLAKIGILGSTNGTDLPAVVESIQNGELKGLAEIAVVVSNVKNSGIIEKARNYGLPYQEIIPVRNQSREWYDKVVDCALSENGGVDLVVNIGYMRLFSNWFVEKYFGKNMNIHPSLLPSFTGMDLDVHKEVINYGCKISGCTLFFIDKGTDTGPIILQEAVPVLETDTPDSLKARVQAAEQRILPAGIKLFAEGRLHLEGRRVRIWHLVTEKYL